MPTTEADRAREARMKKAAALRRRHVGRYQLLMARFNAKR